MTVDWTYQRRWADLEVGQELEPVAFPISLYRLVVAAGANRDFNSIHHNSEFAQRSGAPEAYANTIFLQGMWERVAREFIGLAGDIRAIRGFRMRSFNVVGDTVVVRGRVARLWREDDAGLAELELWSENERGLSVGPGTVTVSLPCEPRDPDEEEARSQRPAGGGPGAAPGINDPGGA